MNVEKKRLNFSKALYMFSRNKTKNWSKILQVNPHFDQVLIVLNDPGPLLIVSKAEWRPLCIYDSTYFVGQKWRRGGPTTHTDNAPKRLSLKGMILLKWGWNSFGKIPQWIDVIGNVSKAFFKSIRISRNIFSLNNYVIRELSLCHSAAAPAPNCISTFLRMFVLRYQASSLYLKYESSQRNVSSLLRSRSLMGIFYCL